ncbi:MAG: DUF6261 family protein [Tannerellaceae bacterium]|nr:DUF6261 family protein [Tannerellaceae bacterium]
MLQRLDAGITHIATLTERLAALLVDEKTALEQSRRYDTTEAIHDADQRRDSAFYGLREAIRTLFRHFDPLKREAARRLDATIAPFRKAPKMALPDESAEIQKLLKELNSPAAREDLASLLLDEWVEEMRTANDIIRSLMSQRNSEAAFKVQYRMKAVREEVDAVYKSITAKLESAAILEETDVYNTLFGEINARIEEYRNLMAREKGRRNLSVDPNLPASENTEKI